MIQRGGTNWTTSLNHISEKTTGTICPSTCIETIQLNNRPESSTPKIVERYILEIIYISFSMICV